MTTTADLEAHLDVLCSGAPEPAFDYAGVALRDALPVVAQAFKKPMRIELVERIEAVFKRYLKAAFVPGLTGADARFIAEVSKAIGFVHKFKPYGVKCATALGYSVFILRPGMGFSFQRHRTRKTELFHMLKTLERGQVYLSTSKAWDANYDKDAFNRWLEGAEDARYDAYRRVPEPGDVYLVTELDTVHTVLGCILEEYATVSTDMVDRLHDQNSGRDEVPIIAAETVNAWLADLPRPMPGMCWKSLSDAPSPLSIAVEDGVQHAVLADTGEFLAERMDVEAGATLTLAADGERARSLFCLGGDAKVFLLAAGDDAHAVDAIALKSGETILIGPGVVVQVDAVAKTSLSSHTIRPALALD